MPSWTGLLAGELAKIIGQALVGGARYAQRKLFGADAEPDGEPHPKTFQDVQHVQEQIRAGTSHGVVYGPRHYSARPPPLPSKPPTSSTLPPPQPFPAPPPLPRPPRVPRSPR